MNIQKHSTSAHNQRYTNIASLIEEDKTVDNDQSRPNLWEDELHFYPKDNETAQVSKLQKKNRESFDIDIVAVRKQTLIQNEPSTPPIKESESPLVKKSFKIDESDIVYIDPSVQGSK